MKQFSTVFIGLLGASVTTLGIALTAHLGEVGGRAETMLWALPCLIAAALLGYVVWYFFWGRPRTAKLRFGELKELPNERIDGENHPPRQVAVWRLPLENTRRGTVARRVRVRIIESNPRSEVFPVDVHRKHGRPLEREHDVVAGDLVEFDIIGQATTEKSLFLYRSDLDQTEPWWELSVQDWASAIDGTGVAMLIRAIAEDGTCATEARFRLTRTAHRDLRVERER